MTKFFRNVFLSALLVLMSHPVGAASKISLHALFKDKAIVVVDGARRVLAVGDTSPEGIKLVSTDTQDETAQIEIDGKVQQLTLGVVMSASSNTKGSVTLYPDTGGHFFADGTINGGSAHFLVDTGATTIALSSVTAKRLGIDYVGTGQPMMASTASGVVRGYSIKLNVVQVGTIQLFGVDAV